MDGLIPSCSLEVHSITENTILWFLCDFLWIEFIINLEVHVQLINGNNMLSGKVLSCTSEESLWEEES
jgi:hypothetical protein